MIYPLYPLLSLSTHHHTNINYLVIHLVYDLYLLFPKNLKNITNNILKAFFLKITQKIKKNQKNSKKIKKIKKIINFL